MRRYDLCAGIHLFRANQSKARLGVFAYFLKYLDCFSLLHLVEN